MATVTKTRKVRNWNKSMKSYDDPSRGENGWHYQPYPAGYGPTASNWAPPPYPNYVNPYLADTVNRWFEELTGAWEGTRDRPWTPRCDFWENANGYTIRCYVAGCTEADCKIECTASTMNISGTCDVNPIPTGSRCYTCESQYGPFQRHFTFPNPINPSTVKAVYKNGVLTVTCKMVTSSKPMHVRVG